MPIQKTNKADILLRCWEVFHREGYNAASISKLAEASGLGKPGLLHHFGSKEQLMQAVLEYAREQFHAYVLSVAQEHLPPEQRLEKLLRRQNRLAKYERRGCFFANMALETGRDEHFNPLITTLFEEWQQTVAGLYALVSTPETAREIAYRLLLEYEGAVTMYKLSNDTAHLEKVVQRAVQQFQALSQTHTTAHV
jgi:AcrR family transcriptional regulator